MARKLTKVGAQNQPAEKSVTASVTLTVTEDTATYYLNSVEVGQSFFEFALFFGKIPAKPTATQMKAVHDTRRLELPAVLQILIPPTLVPGLIYALTTERKKYEEAHGVKLPEMPAPPASRPESASNAH